MKTIKYVSMAAIALAMTACSNDENGVVDNNTPVAIRLTSGVEVQTRAAEGKTQATSIAEGEVVNVWVDNATTKQSLYKAIAHTADGDGGFTYSGYTQYWMFFPQTGNNVDIYALHGPFTTEFVSGTTEFPTASVEFKVATNQVEVADYTKSDLLYAKVTNVDRTGAVEGKRVTNDPGRIKTQNLTFYHMLSKLELCVYSGSENGKPVLAESGGITLDGMTIDGVFTPSKDADMTGADNRAQMVAAKNGATTATMTLAQTVSTGTDEPRTLFNEAIIIPQNMKDKVLTFHLKDGGELKYTFPEVTFESGKKYQYIITLKLTGLEVSSTIFNWVNDRTTPGNATM